MLDDLETPESSRNNPIEIPVNGARMAPYLDNYLRRDFKFLQKWPMFSPTLASAVGFLLFLNHLGVEEAFARTRETRKIEDISGVMTRQLCQIPGISRFMLKEWTARQKMCLQEQATAELLGRPLRSTALLPDEIFTSMVLEATLGESSEIFGEQVPYFFEAVQYCYLTDWLVRHPRLFVDSWVLYALSMHWNSLGPFPREVEAKWWEVLWNHPFSELQEMVPLGFRTPRFIDRDEDSLNAQMLDAVKIDMVRVIEDSFHDYEEKKKLSVQAGSRRINGIALVRTFDFRERGLEALHLAIQFDAWQTMEFLMEKIDWTEVRPFAFLRSWEMFEFWLPRVPKTLNGEDLRCLGCLLGATEAYLNFHDLFFSNLRNPLEVVGPKTPSEFLQGMEGQTLSLKKLAYLRFFGLSTLTDMLTKYDIPAIPEQLFRCLLQGHPPAETARLLTILSNKLHAGEFQVLLQFVCLHEDNLAEYVMREFDLLPESQRAVFFYPLREVHTLSGEIEATSNREVIQNLLKQIEPLLEKIRSLLAAGFWRLSETQPCNAKLLYKSPFLYEFLPHALRVGMKFKPDKIVCLGWTKNWILEPDQVLRSIADQIEPDFPKAAQEIRVLLDD